MKLSYKWLMGYFSVEGGDAEALLPVERVAGILTSVGLEVEEVVPFESVPGGLEGLVIGEVLKVGKHPNADRLQVTAVSTGSGEPKQIVCGAPNVAAGQKVIVALPGTTIHPLQGEPFEIKDAVIRKIASSGMICAEDEIGLGTSHEGIMVLPNDVPAGMKAADYFNVQKDWVMDVALTPNRADANSHLGVARDIYAYLAIHEHQDLELQEPALQEITPDNNALNIDVEVKNTTACTRYSAITFTNVVVKPSPEWLQNKLRAIDVKPINNVVDITNFILHEYGQPLHAFDAAKIKEKVIVKTLPAKTKFTTLDKEDRELHEDDLMICDADGGMCIAGVYGGVGTGVTESTTSVFLESAVFDPVYIRKTAARHNLRTDAATHFEKGVDPAGTVKALQRAAQLLRELADARISSNAIDIYPQPVQRKKVQLEYDYLEKMAGIQLDPEKVTTILHALDIKIFSESEKGIELRIPTAKNEVTRPADVAEEILRIYGYDNIPVAQKFSISISPENGGGAGKLDEEVAALLVGQGFHEMTNLSFADKQVLAKFMEEVDWVDLHNPLSAEMDIMRPTLLPATLQALERNINHRNLNLRLFEFGRVYFKKGDGYSQEQHLALAMTGNRYEESWKEAEQPVDIFDLKQVINHILEKAGLSPKTGSDNLPSYISSGFSIEVNGKQIGWAGAVDDRVRKFFDVRQPVFYAELNWKAIEKATRKKKIQFEPIPKYPSIRRDLALILDKKVQYEEIARLARKQVRHLEAVNLFDVYEDPKLGEGKKSYAISFIFQHPEKTLTDKEVDKELAKLQNQLEQQLNAVIRK